VRRAFSGEGGNGRAGLAQGASEIVAKLNGCSVALVESAEESCNRPGEDIHAEGGSPVLLQNPPPLRAHRTIVPVHALNDQELGLEACPEPSAQQQRNTTLAAILQVRVVVEKKCELLKVQAFFLR